jgi:hypothetical protein
VWTFGSSQATQSQATEQSQSQRRFQPLLVAGMEDVARLWAGLAPSLLLTTNPAIQHTVFDQLKLRRLSRNNSPGGQQPQLLKTGEAFLIAAAGKILATLITYPLIRAKVQQ